MREKRHGFFVTGTVAIIIILAQHLLVHLAFGDEGANKTSQYIFVTIDFPTPDGKFGFTNLNDMNDKGEIVGGFSDILFDVQAGFLLKENFRSTDIQCPNAAFTEAETINKHGEIAGHCFAAGAGPNRSGFFRDKKGKYTFLDFPGATLIEAIGINDDGQVVGDYRDSSGTFRGFFWDAGLFLTFDVPFPGATLTGPSGINNVGQIVGFFLDADGDSRRGFLYDNGFFTAFNFPGSRRTFPSDINDHGDIVGIYVDSDLVAHSFLLEDHRFFTIDVPFPNVIQTVVRGINNRGQIVGRYLDNNFNSHGFIATPISEPRSKSPPLVSKPK